MASRDWMQFAAYVIGLTALTPILGKFLFQVFSGDRHIMSRPLLWLENLLYRFCGIDPSEEMNWKQYAWALVVFNLIGIFAVFAIQMMQGFLPLNPQGLPGVGWHSALNTAVSFITNTNWQGYSGEVTMSYFTQMVALGVQNFLSAAVGITVVLALARGFARKNATTLGNFWTDLTRSALYILLPICIVYALFLVSQGVVQTFAPYVKALTLEGTAQSIPLGPVASQVAIKMLGTNGGGFFNANAAHPFENSSPLCNFIQMLSIFALPAALVYMYGLMVGSKRHAWTLYGAMMAMFLVLTLGAICSEYTMNPVFHTAGMMEGKETRFGVFGSTLFSMITTMASCGAVNAMHASLAPLTGGIAMLNMMVGEVIFGGVGAGLYGMIHFVLLTVFLAGLMVGRTPEYLGKKIEAREMTMVLLAVLAPCAVILLGAGVSLVLPVALSSLGNAGPHGLSEILYAFTSAAANNGSAFAGLNANTLYYNLALAVVMLIGRFAVILPALAVAGSLVGKKISPPSPGTFATDTPLFALLLIGVILIVGALTFFPALTLGPIVEHFLMLKGQSF
jgi:K+-transporting ATPase ATPase A chain